MKVYIEIVRYNKYGMHHWKVYTDGNPCVRYGTSRNLLSAKWTARRAARKYKRTYDRGTEEVVYAEEIS